LPNPTDTKRKLVAIFAADVEGYSSLMEADEVGTLQDLTERRAILDGLIASHRGRIANTAGDSVLAEFGSVVDAVAVRGRSSGGVCQSQHRLVAGASPQLPYRHPRRRYHGQGRRPLRRWSEYRCKAANNRQRRRRCISGAAHDHVRKILPYVFVDLGAQHVKNIEDPVRAFLRWARQETRERLHPVLPAGNMRHLSGTLTNRFHCPINPLLPCCHSRT